MKNYRRQIAGTICFFGWMLHSAALSAQAPAKAAAGQKAPPVAFSLEKENALQKPLSVEATDLPLEVVLRDLSLQADLSLTTTQKIGDQRVTLQIHDQPLSHIMLRLTGLLSHTPNAPRGYFWERMSKADDVHPRYRLDRDLRSIQEEVEALDMPRRKASRMLRDMRDLSRMSPEQRKLYKGELAASYIEEPDLHLFREALTSASDTQIDTLVQTGSMPLNPTQFADRIARYNRLWHDRELQRRQRQVAAGGRDPYPAGVPDAPPDSPTVLFQQNDENGDQPDRSAMFGLELHGIQTVDRPDLSTTLHIVFSPQQKTHPPFSDVAQPGEAVIDLTPALTAPEVTLEQRGDVGFTLQVLAKAAGISLYQEEFYKTVYRGGRSQGVRRMKGTVPQLLNAICAEWDYDALKVGDDYALWSNSWAQDRQRDIPERQIAVWRRRMVKQGGFTFNDRVEMAGQLTWPQLRLTLEMLLPESGEWTFHPEVELIRFLGSFSTGERASMQGAGMPIAAMTPGQQQLLANEIHRRTNANPPVEFEQARFFLVPNKDWKHAGRRTVLLEVRTEQGMSLLRANVEYLAVLDEQKREKQP